MAAAGKPGKARAVGSRVTGAGTKTVVSTAEEAAHIIGYLQTKAIPPHLQGTDVRTKRFKFIAKAELFTVFAGVDGVARLSIKRPDGRSLPVVYMSEHDRARAIAQEAHVATGHGDRHKTHTMVGMKYAGIRQRVSEDVVKECTACQSANTLKTRPEMRAITSAGPWDHIQIDLVDLHTYAASNEGMAWLLTIIDIFSKYTFAYPLPTKRAENVVAALAHLFSNEGVPGIVQSDNGTEFATGLLQNMAATLDFELRHGRPRHPQSQGQIERFNQTINHIIGKLLYTDSGMPQERPWLDVLPDALFAYNTRIHSAHNHSPFQVFRGRAPHGQIPVQQDETTEEDTRELITKRAEWLASFRGQISGKSSEYVKNMLRNNAIHGRTFFVNDAVLVGEDYDRNTKTRKTKFSMQFLQAGTVVEADVSGEQRMYRVRLASGEEIVAHSRRLKKALKPGDLEATRTVKKAKVADAPRKPGSASTGASSSKAPVQDAETDNEGDD